jgi:hypothetical protein
MTCNVADLVVLGLFGLLALSTLFGMVAMCMSFWYDKRADELRRGIK